MELLAKNYSSFKKQKQEKYKRFLKRNLPNVEMAHWLTKYTNKEITFHYNCYISYNHPYISSSDTLLVGTRFTVTFRWSGGQEQVTQVCDQLAMVRAPSWFARESLGIA